MGEAWSVCTIFSYEISKEREKVFKMDYNCSGSITGQCCNALPQAPMRNLKSDDRLKQPCIFSVDSIYFWLKELSKEYTKNGQD